MVRMVVFLYIVLLCAQVHAGAQNDICEMLDKSEGGELVHKGDLTDGDHQEINIRSFRGKKIILYFWTIWAPECMEDMKELDHINKLLVEKEEDDIVILPVLLCERTSDVQHVMDNMDRFYRTHKISSLPRYIDLNIKFYTALQNKSGQIPFFIIIDKNGREIGRHGGQIMAQLPKTGELIRQLKSCY